MPFPPPYATLLIDDPSGNVALIGAIGNAQIRFPAAQLVRLAVSIVEIDESVTPFRFQHAGLRSGNPSIFAFNETYYAASLLKVAVMYAAFELRNSCRKFAFSGVTTPAAFFNDLRNAFDPAIDASVPEMPSFSIPQALRLPKYELIFDPPFASGTSPVEFSAAFLKSLREMIVNSDNGAATTCIAALGYSWINGALRAGGFFRFPARAGIWVGADYIRSLPRAEIASANDGAAAHVTTCFDMANLYAHIWQRSLVADGGQSSAEMLALLADAQSNETSWIDWRNPLRRVLPRAYLTTHTKIGVGSLKGPAGPESGPSVLSEATFLLEQPPGVKKLLVVWVNMLDTDPDKNAIADLVEGYMKRP